jgi:hypothetical protein
MTDIFGYKPGQPINWFKKKLAESNQYCLYCGELVGSGSQVESDKEHLIGRNFVPKGSLDGRSFNFHFRACRECNGRKGDAERHVSSVTLFNSPARLSDKEVNAIAEHKASRDYHPDKKGVLVRDAHNEHEVKTESGPMQMTFGLVGPPQVNSTGVRLLACNHVQGLFALLTTEDPRVREKSRILLADQCHLFGYYTYQDWGNPHLVEMTRRVDDWPCYANIDAANGYFKAILKRSREELGGWFWAIEWNKYLRIVGVVNFLYSESSLFDGLPDLGWQGLPDGKGKRRYRKQVPLLPESDTLFLSQVASNEDSPSQQ